MIFEIVSLAFILYVIINWNKLREKWIKQRMSSPEEKLKKIDEMVKEVEDEKRKI